MKLYVDADACPKAIKTILCRVADKRKISTYFVANQPLRLPYSNYLQAIQVSAGFDVADNKIVELAVMGDVVITADIPLASQLVSQQVHAINPRGEIYTPENIHDKLAMRNLMSELRDAGQVRGGPAALSAKDVQQFSNALDRLLTRLKG